MPESAGIVSGFVDEARLWRRHMELAQFGATGKGGVNRQALSAEEIQARRRLASWAAELGLGVFVDAAGNLFLRRDGSDPGLPPVMTGSHIDSQPTGGKFDGAYGVLAGIEAVEAMNDAGVATRRSIEVAAWMNEEGSRFAPGMMGSEAFAGLRGMEEILTVRDRDGTPVRDALPAALAATPDAGELPLGRPVAAFVEAHIEQGPELERLGKTIGIVTGIQGVRRMRVRVTGEEAHAGTTPRAVRKDALWEAARMVSALHDRLHADEDVRFTVGMMLPEPNVPSVVASGAVFSIDIRHPDSALLERLASEVGGICRDRSVACDVEAWRIAEADSIEFEPLVVEAVEAAADRLGLPAMRMFSGAGHDARQLHFVCPTGMIFVPCEKGISHNEAENAAPEDLADGARVLAETLVGLADAAD